MATTEETFGSTGHINIFLRSWLPEGAPRAVVVICHGFNSHSGQYAWVAERLVEKGFAVYAADLRGRGRSDGERFYVEKVGEYVDDLGGAIAIAKSRHPGLKTFLLGHSAGGVVSATYVLDNQAQLAGFICEDFAFQVPAPAFALAAIKGLSHIAPHLGVLKLKNEDFSRDPAHVAALNADPYIKDETQPAATVAALVRADERLHDEFPTVTLPLLILHGTADRATVYHGSEFFYKTAGSSDKTLKLYEGHYHDLLADLGKESVMGDILAWLEVRA
ncbi:lysophospholipase [Sphingomonas sp. HITSZ_GF]|uniref:alpha/beta hydrolase n=1 Tax=Sphingomonas sp. HITSZ_GF TaxID=3037247 RepID=UPI00240E0ABC|nr:alpha/beta hydrolase [Sphingomonas sp. HITSZ_GF]MDG2533137.1 lysophospholipase [Sphingomonas sp. HITSZ_GF]